jgi:hypothetical protein
VFYSENNFEYHKDLDVSSNYDLITSCVIYDATFSGYNSIVLGTFGKMVLFFCPVLVNAEEIVDKQATLTRDSESLDDYDTNENPSKLIIGYELKREIQFKHSILGLAATLLSNNGAYDLVILTLNGISIWQYDPDKLIELLHARIEVKEKKSIETKQSESITA